MVNLKKFNSTTTQLFSLGRIQLDEVKQTKAKFILGLPITVIAYKKVWKRNLNDVEGLNKAVVNHLINIEKL